MTLTLKQRQELIAKAEPLMKWIAENLNPHCEVKVDCNTVKLTEDVMFHRTDEFIKD